MSDCSCAVLNHFNPAPMWEKPCGFSSLEKRKTQSNEPVCVQGMFLLLSSVTYIIIIIIIIYIIIHIYIAILKYIQILTWQCHLVMLCIDIILNFYLFLKVTFCSIWSCLTVKFRKTGQRDQREYNYSSHQVSTSGRLFLMHQLVADGVKVDY